MSANKIIEAQYVGSCFNVLLSYRNRTLDVTDYTFGLPSITTQVENETAGYGRAQLSRLSIDFDREEVEGFLSPLGDGEIGITIKHYLFGGSEIDRIFTGVAEDLPSFMDSVSEDKLTITFVSRLGTCGDGDNIVDPNTGEEYRFISVNDLITAFDNEFGGTIRRSAEVPISIQAGERWWSTLFRPFKKRIKDNETYDNTIKPRAIASDGTYLYYPIDNWLVRYNPETGEEKRIAQIGHGTEIIYLEYDSGNIYYITDETDTEGVANRGYGSRTLATIGTYIFPDEYFYKYDGGCTVQAKNILRHNYKTSGDTDPALATWDTQMIGDGNVPPDKNLSTSRPYRGVKDGLVTPGVVGNHYVYIDGTLLDVPDGLPADWINLIGWHCQIEGDGNGQQLGLCTKVEWNGAYKITFENPLKYDFAITANIFFFTPEIWPTKNLFIPTYLNLAAAFDKDELSDRDIQDVVIERRFRGEGRQSFYYPDILAELGDGDDALIEPGYVSMTACDSAEEFTNINGHEEYKADTCAGFSVTLDWIDTEGQYLLADGFRVENDMQGSNYELCGPNKVMLNGTQCKWNNGEDVKTYGNIYLTKNDKILLVCNEYRFENDKYVPYIRAGVWDSALQRFFQFYRAANGYQATSGIVYKNDIVYGGAKLYERNGVKTGLQIIWARPPQGDYKPHDNDGGYTATVLTLGDNTDIFERSGIIRLGSTATGDAGAKEYIISEAQVVTRQLNDTGSDYTVPGYETHKGKFTVLILKSIDTRFGNTGYQGQINGEILGNYITVAQGWDIKSVAYKIAGGAFSVIDTATRSNKARAEGREEQEETITIDYDSDWDDCPRVELDESRVLTGVRCWLKNQELTGTDYTNELRIPEPPAGEFYYKRNQGSDFNDTYLYFNDIYTNLEVKVEYSFYPEDVEFRSFAIFKDKIYYNEIGDFNKWLCYNSVIAAVADDYSVGVNEEGFYSNLAECDGILYGFTYPSYTLRQYDFAWSGYIEYAKTENIRAWDILSRIASACDCALYERLNEYHFIRRDRFKYRGGLELHGPIKKTLIQPFKTITINYANGVCKIGEGEPEYSRSCEYVSDYRHALIIANAVKQFYENDVPKYEIEMLTFRPDIRPLDLFRFEHGGEYKSGYVVETGLNPSSDTTRLVLYGADLARSSL